MADWLNTVFYALDKGAFNFVNNLSLKADGFFNPLCSLFAFLGKGGICFLIASVLLLLFKKTRRTGFTMLLAIGVGALFTNVIIKNLVARPRPYTVEEFKGFWQAVGANLESEFSFPSGHTTVAMTSMTALFLTSNKKWSWLAFFVALIMAFSRVYLVVHYLTDVLAGLIVGGVSGLIAYFIGRWIYKIIDKNQNNKFCVFVQNADILDLFKKK